MSKREPQATGDRDLDAKARSTPKETQKLAPGPERDEVLKKATMLRNAEETYNYLFSRELEPPK